MELVPSRNFISVLQTRAISNGCGHASAIRLFNFEQGQGGGGCDWIVNYDDGYENEMEWNEME